MCFSFDSSEGKYGVAVPVLGFALGLLLYRRNPRKFNFLQELCSLEMWGSGSNQRVCILDIYVMISFFVGSAIHL